MTLPIGSEDSLKRTHPAFAGCVFLATFRTYGLRRRTFPVISRQAEPQSADREFFIEERTASNIILDNDEYYRELIRNKTTRKQLRRTYPGFDWN